MSTLNILVTDGQWRKALATVRSLGKRGHHVTVIGNSILTTSFFSKYCKKRVILPCIEKGEDISIQALLNLLKKNKFDILIPLEDKTIETCLNYRDIIEKYTLLPLAPKQIIELFRDKSKTFQLAYKFKLPHPKTYIFNDINEFLINYKNLKPPLIIKPRKSSGSRGLIRINSIDKIYSGYMKVHEQFKLPIIQELIPDGGRTRGVSILMDKNQNLVGSFVHERIREFPVQGGPSTLRKSVIDKDLLNLSISFLKKINWVGFAMLEYKEDPRDKKFKLIEVNPRFVGSLQLAISAGVDFPNLLVNAFALNKYSVVNSYKSDIYCRWLLPGDILHFLSNPDRFKLNPSFFKFFDKNLYYDICTFDDPLPILGRILTIIKEFFQPSSWQKYIFRKK